MKPQGSKIWNILILSLFFTQYVDASSISPVQLEKYEESIKVDKVGNIISDIIIYFNQPYTTIKMPLLKVETIEILHTSKGTNAIVFGSDADKYLQISTIRSDSLPYSIELEIMYGYPYVAPSFWNIFQKQRRSLAYSRIENQRIESAEFNIELTSSSIYKFNKNENDIFQILEVDKAEMIKNGDSGKLTLYASNTNLDGIDLGVLRMNSSNSYVGHLLFILFLIGVYHTFLKYVINN